MTLPQRVAVILKRCFAVLHPCLYGGLNGGEAVDVEAIARDLEKEIAFLSLDMDAKSVARKFVEALPEVHRLIDTDVAAAYEGDPAATSPMEVVMAYPGLYAITVHRLAHVLYSLKVPIIPRVMSELAHSKTGIDIHPGATIGHHFSIDHGTGIVIGETSVIGDYVRIFQGVSLAGAKLPPDEKGNTIRGIARHPILGNHVTVYSNATLIGKIHIGDGATICGNVWVAEDVPAGATVSQPERKYKLM